VSTLATFKHELVHIGLHASLGLARGQHHPVPLPHMTHITTAQRKLRPSGGHFSLDDQRCGVSCMNVQYAETLTVPDRDLRLLQASKTWDEHVRSSGLPENRETAVTLMSVMPD
jgi:hypothetical protein